MKRMGTLLAAIALLGMSISIAQEASASPDGCAASSTLSTDSKAVAADLVANAPPAVITAVRVGHHATCDRVTVDYTGALSGYDIGYVPKVVGDASGQTIKLEGSAFISVVLSHTSTTKPAPQQDQKPEFPVLREVRGAGDFEGTTSYGLGLRSKQPFAVYTLESPSRIVIDIHVPGQVAKVPSGGVATGQGSTSQFPRTRLLIAAGCLVATGGGLFVLRRVLGRP